jgi:HEAT repeat protein
MYKIGDIKSSKASPWVIRLATIVALLSFSRFSYHVTVSFLLSRVGYNQTSAIQFARGQLQSSSSSVRQAAASALGAIGPKAEVSVSDLLSRLRHDSPNVAAASAWALGYIYTDAARNPKPIDPEVIPALIQALDNSDHEVRRYAAYAIGLIGPRALSATPKLTQLLGDPNLSIRYTAAHSLSEMGAVATGSIGPMTALLSEPQALVRLEAIQDISRLTPCPWPAATVSAVQKCQDDDDERVRDAAKRALAERLAN